MCEFALLDVYKAKHECDARQFCRAAWQLCCTFVLALFLPLMASAGDLSGDYIGEGKNIAVLLQILPVGQGKVVGRLRTVSVDEKGELKVFDRPLAGAANGESFIGKLEASWIKGGDVAISGSMNGRYLLVSAANGLKAALRAGEEAQFNKAAEQLSREGSNIRQQARLIEVRRKSQEKADRTASQIAGLRAKIEEFSSQEPRIVAEQAREAQRYSHLTKKMQTNYLSFRPLLRKQGKQRATDLALIPISIT